MHTFLALMAITSIVGMIIGAVSAFKCFIRGNRPLEFERAIFVFIGSSIGLAAVPSLLNLG